MKISNSVKKGHISQVLQIGQKHHAKSAWLSLNKKKIHVPSQAFIQKEVAEVVKSIFAFVKR